jgi:hypothetical protein
VLESVPVGDAYDIPLRCLLPRGVDHVLIAGRCISGTQEADSSYRDPDRDGRQGDGGLGRDDQAAAS